MVEGPRLFNALPWELSIIFQVNIGQIFGPSTYLTDLPLQCIPPRRLTKLDTHQTHTETGGT